VTFKWRFSRVIDFAAIVLTFTVCTAMGQACGAFSRGLSYANLDVRGDMFVDVDSLSDGPAVINV